MTDKGKSNAVKNTDWCSQNLLSTFNVTVYHSIFASLEKSGILCFERWSKM